MRDIEKYIFKIWKNNEECKMSVKFEVIICFLIRGMPPKDEPPFVVTFKAMCVLRGLLRFASSQQAKGNYS